MSKPFQDDLEWMRGFGFSQRDIGYMLGTSEATVVTWKKGGRGNIHTLQSAMAFLVLLKHLEKTAGAEWIRGIRGYTPMMWISVAISRGLLK